MLHSPKNVISPIFGPASRISFGLVLITISVVILADLFGLVPNESNMKLENRKILSESFAIQFSALAVEKDIKTIRKVLSAIVKRDDELLSAGFRDSTGVLIFQVGDHHKYWGNYQYHRQSTTSHVLVPIYQKKIPLGNIELRFKPLPFETVKGYLSSDLYRLLLFLLIVCFMGFLFFMLRTLKQLDPSSVIPGRVNAAFDTLAEGVLILDEKENIVMANTAFVENLGRTPASLLGVRASSLGWQHTNSEDHDLPYPWTLVQESKEAYVGETLLLETPFKKIRTMAVNCAPIIDGKARKRGVIATFDDQTEYQEQNLKLQQLNVELENTNQQLHYLATRDSLTGCLNRRAFNDLFKKAFDHAKQNQLELICLMVDIDHFKLVNDNYGHATGDEVIKLIANVLSEITREQDIVGRYGGEEFCVVLPGLSSDQAVDVAEKIRLQLFVASKQTFESGPHITGSLGVASIKQNAKDPDELNNQADKALYVAKETGRNKVVVWKPDLDKSNVKLEQSKPEALDIERISFNQSNTANNALDEKIKQLENLAAMFSKKSTKSQ